MEAPRAIFLDHLQHGFDERIAHHDHVIDSVCLHCLPQFPWIEGARLQDNHGAAKYLSLDTAIDDSRGVHQGAGG